MRTIGAVIIGILTYLAGYPIYSTENGFSILNTLLVIGLAALWWMLCDIVGDKND